MKRIRLVSLVGLVTALCVFWMVILRTDWDASPSPAIVPRIPSLLHQSWKTKDLPKEYVAWGSSWLKHNPRFTYRLWTDEDNRALVAEHYAWFLPTFDGFERNIMRADAARVFYLHRFGGVYADFDVICLRQMDSLLASHDLVLASMDVPALNISDADNVFFDANSIPNAWMASVPEHPFWLHCAKLMMRLSEEGEDGVEQKTGPMMLKRALSEYNAILQNDTIKSAEKLLPIFIAEPNAIFPYSWVWTQNTDTHKVCSSQRKTFNEARCRKLVDPKRTSFAISYWSHSWDK
ncbi:hypothetical protein CcCBS67573_g01887 [Chytriomyces confervae]|uniref:Alpha 1,4-glycosyltransferase domain-containing protein n=1 Tax=Chytriomyces confervae TaxID=246404 RepID=A0A507FND0_9FUNG|nr:hypothetical protein HDU80_011266 [Chytriomyces hyalinus]TPX76836.1 hypothetical protein CcCBS67573_g01887 [Chytriomyces confervae]